MDTLLPPMNPEVARLRRLSAQRKYKKRLRQVRLLWVVAGMLLLVLGVEAGIALCFSPRFWVYRINVIGNDTLPEGEIIRLLDLRAHSNFYRAPLARLQQRVAVHPRVDTVTVKRGSVGALIVTVRERQAVCRIGAVRPPLYLDAAGMAFTRPVAPRPAVPVVEGIDVPSAKKVEGTRLASARVTTALACLAALRNTAPKETPLQISRVLFDPERGYITLVLPQGAKVLVGRPRHLPAKAWVIHEVIARARAKGQSLDQIDYIDVRVIEKPTDLGAAIKLKPEQEVTTP